MKDIIILLIVFSCIFFVGCEDIAVFRNSNNSILSVHFIDVGQGDCTLIITPDKKTMLIDAGDNNSGKTVYNYLKKHNINKIDILIGTHPDADHIGGLDYIIHNFEIGDFYMPKKSHTTKTFKDVLLAAKSKGLKIKEAKYGIDFYLGDHVYFKMLNPSREYTNNNNLYSVVLKATYKDKSFLFTGDAEIENEIDMIKSGENLKSNVLKLGHHGSSSSTSEQFLLSVLPDVAVVSCKYKNQYSHPHKEVLDLLKKYNIPLYRTDEQGSIVFFSDGKTIWTDKNPGSYNYYKGR
ncbi:Metal-dependent hydrolase, beta-lactamase superfamily II [Alkalithermobacter thermoalcaliphilus JW-YL-7 = DSM 7308]|uniref:Beta-lactamase domain protein n=1 Tax=Alkalithermobacter thermoalcaliphilus JW-YL-7 = DSM 7308 TaxID=1121328 RepID=A0A150FSF6_CLOPD|nr:beta-lactamase domain protein [[Clostridium] paradoxum JW-YL-7 = DSM 7308]SHL01858.1 Metal-dependent hydrolase, beta-lactamase superfamily II [[Clostridium] paradoxum JW-YL-7 = DSM 7308]